MGLELAFRQYLVYQKWSPYAQDMSKKPQVGQNDPGVHVKADVVLMSC